MEDIDDLVVETDLLDGRFAIDEQDIGSIFVEFSGKFAKCFLTKMNPRRILI
jgi:hypothetical protein